MNPILKWGAICGALVAISGAATVLGVQLPPWSPRADIEALAGEVQQNYQVQQQLTADLLLLRRDYWRQIETAAERDLREVPTSSSAEREVKRARDAIKLIDLQMEILAREGAP